MYTTINGTLVAAEVANGVCHQVVMLCHDDEISTSFESHVSIGPRCENFREAVELFERLPNRGYIQTFLNNDDGTPSSKITGSHYSKDKGGMNYQDIDSFVAADAAMRVENNYSFLTEKPEPKRVQCIAENVPESGAKGTACYIHGDLWKFVPDEPCGRTHWYFSSNEIQSLPRVENCVISFSKDDIDRIPETLKLDLVLSKKHEDGRVECFFYGYDREVPLKENFKQLLDAGISFKGQSYRTGEAFIETPYMFVHWDGQFAYTDWDDQTGCVYYNTTTDDVTGLESFDEASILFQDLHRKWAEHWTLDLSQEQCY